MIRLIHEPIELAGLHEADPRDGASCVFLGVVRNENKGRVVVSLEYEAYEDMALALMEQIAAETRERFPSITRLVMIHRLGHLQIGDASVAVAVSSPHRAVAFEACRHAIDTLKAKVPIWKKEHYADGGVWLDEREPA